MVIEDNPYGELRYEGDFLPSVKSFRQRGNVLVQEPFPRFSAPAIGLAGSQGKRGDTQICAGESGAWICSAIRWRRWLFLLSWKSIISTIILIKYGRYTTEGVMRQWIPLSVFPGQYQIHEAGGRPFPLGGAGWKEVEYDQAS